MRSAKFPLCSTGGFSPSSTMDSVRSIEEDMSDAELSLRGRNESSSGMSSSFASSSFASSFASWIWVDRRWLASVAMLLLLRSDLGAGFFSTGFASGFVSGFVSAGFITIAFSFRFSVSRRMSVSTCPSDRARTMRLM